MRQTLTTIAVALALCGCAHHQQTAEAAFDAAEKSLRGIDVGIRGSQKAVDAATDARMERCQGAEDREACMGHLAVEVAPIYEKAAAAYDAAVEALAALEKAYGELAPVIEDATEELGQ